MSGSQKVFLRIVGLIGDSDDPGEMPDRVNVTGRGRLVPTIAAGTGDVAQGPDSLHEIRLIEPVPFEIIDGMLTYNAKPYVWLPVPTGEWMWRITFDHVRVGEQLRELRDFLFPLDAATPAQIADEGYPGVNLAQYGIGSWEPGTVNLTAEAISQITIYLGRASNAAISAEGHADRAEAAIGQIDEDADRAEAAALAATTAKNEAVTARGVAVTKAGEASDSAAAAATAKEAAESARATSVTKAGEASDSAAAAQVLHDDVAAAVAQFDVDFAADMALFTGIRDDINLVANEVANDANRAEDAAQATEDALTVVRAHRWVPQGAWEYDLGYSAGDVVVYDGSSYYAQEDIPAGIEPPGGNWMVLGQGGITDAAELTGALTEYVDSSRTTIDLGSYVPGVEPELQAAQLAAILGHLYLSLESSVEASRVTGALTDQVDVSSSMVTVSYENLETGQTEYDTTTLVEFLSLIPEAMQGWAASLDYYGSLIELKSDKGHTHTIGDTDGLQAALNGKAPDTHTHTWSQISDAPSYSKDMIGDNLVQRNASGHINVPSGAGPLNAPRRAEVDAAINAKIQLVTEFPSSPTPGVLYLIAED